MSRVMSGESLAVIGGGVIGLSVARCAALAGLTVRLHSDDRRGASWVAGGMLAPHSEAWPGEEQLLAIGLESVRLWHETGPGGFLDGLPPDVVTARESLVVAVDRADAALANARLQVVSLRSAYDQQKLILASDLRTQAYADKEAARQRALADAGVASRQQADEAAHAADLAAAAVDVARQQTAAALANLGPAVNNTDAYPAVMQAKAAREAAGLDLTHTIIIASQDGVVTRVDQLQLGAYINTSQTVFWLLSGQPRVAANFKEDQLAKMRVGQPATIKIDALGGREFAGHVDSFSPGAGDSFSPLPAQNATGNWVKVVQRLPVRISFDKAPPDIAARAGLSTKVTVDVRSASRSTPAPQG